MFPDLLRMFDVSICLSKVNATFKWGSEVVASLLEYIFGCIAWKWWYNLPGYVLPWTECAPR